MPPLYRLAEIAVYSLLNFVPYIFLAIYPFRRNLRFGKVQTYTVITLLCIMQVGFGIWTAFFDDDNAQVISIISTLSYAVFYFVVVKAHFGKTLFTLLMLSNLSSFIVTSSKCLEGFIFPEMARQDYRWSYSLAMLPILLLIMIPMFIYFKKQYTPAVEKKTVGIEWRYLWLIPTTFYLIWYYNIYYRNQSALEIALSPDITIIFLLINIGAILIYSVVIRLINEQAKRAELEEKNHQYVMQSLQYENLRERINEARQARHDLRHHLTVVKGYSENKEYDKLDEYLNSYLNTVPDDSTLVFCEHYVINMVTLNYAHIAKENGINFAAELKIPSDIPVTDTDLGVLLGNLLENAIEACMAMKSDDRKIIFHGKIDGGNALIFTLDNTYEGKPKQSPDGIYLSTKHRGNGIGIESVKSIVGRYDGVFKNEQKDGMFRVSVLLNM